MTQLEKVFLEPINTITHLIAALAATVGLFWLIALTADEPAKMVSLIVYGVCQIFLFISSSLLHGVRTTPKWNFFFNRLDHAAIFFMIAGVYTPIAFNLLPPPWREGTLAVVWSTVVIGAVFKFYNQRIHGFFNAIIYVLMSWGVVLPLILFLDIQTIFTQQGLRLLIIGGVIYTAGFFIYYLEWPNPWPKWLEHHEIWHLFVMAASFAHFLFMLQEVVPA